MAFRTDDVQRVFRRERGVRRRGFARRHVVRQFVDRFAAEYQKPIRGISPAALRILASARFPGNVRQLRDAVMAAAWAAQGDEVRRSDILDFSNLGERQWRNEGSDSFPIAADESLADFLERATLEYFRRQLELHGRHRGVEHPGPGRHAGIVGRI